jgi:hypothetical protein
MPKKSLKCQRDAIFYGIIRFLLRLFLLSLPRLCNRIQEFVVGNG